MRRPHVSPGLPAHEPVDRTLQWAVGLLSSAITAQQLALMQVLAYLHWHHFAYMVVAVALLGFGAAGTVLACWRRPLLARADALLPWLMLACGATLPLGLRLSQTRLLGFDLHLLFVQPGQWLALLGVYLLVLPPFLSGGLATSLVLTAKAAQAGRYYFASLAGAGAGGLAGLAALEFVAPPRLAALVSLPAVLGGLCLWRNLTARGRPVAALVAVAALSLVAVGGELRASQFKPIRGALDLPGARIIGAAPSAHGWLQAVEAPALRPAPPLSLQYTGDVPPHPAVFVNGLPHGALLPAAAASEAPWMAATTDAVAYAIASRPRVLLLECGPGGAAALARLQGARQVVVVESHPRLVEWAAAPSEAGPAVPEWSQPGVRVVRSSGRAHLRRTRDRFDLIQLPPAGSPGGAGLGSTTERFLLTREAVEAAFRRLAPAGALTITAPLDPPVRHPLRVIATVVSALDRAGVSDPSRHVAAIRSWNVVTVVVQQTPLDGTAVAAVRRFADSNSFDLLALPGLDPDERNRFNFWPDESLFVGTDALLGAERRRWIDGYSFRIEAADDSRPWFEQFLRWSRIPELAGSFGWRELANLELGTVLVGLTVLQLAALAVLCTLLPLPWLGGARRGRWATLAYFSGLGAGFMGVEIALMLRLNAWFGQSLLGAGVVLTGLLVSSGLGSLWSERWPAGRGARARVTLACGSLVMLEWLGLMLVAPATAGWPLGGLIPLALGLMLPLGLALGMAFPLGLRHLEQEDPAQLPWAWGVNGCVSVATPAAAMLLAMEAGVSLLLVAAALAYVVAHFAVRLSRSVLPE